MGMGLILKHRINEGVRVTRTIGDVRDYFDVIVKEINPSLESSVLDVIKDEDSERITAQRGIWSEIYGVGIYVVGAGPNDAKFAYKAPKETHHILRKEYWVKLDSGLVIPKN